MLNIIVRCGLIRLNTNPITYKTVNIVMRASPLWLQGILYIKEVPYYRISSNKDNKIELRELNDHYLLAINNRTIYCAEDIFGYKIGINLNNRIQDRNRPCSDFLNYY